MIRNFDIKIKRASVRDFLDRCNEMESVVFPMMEAKGYVTNFQLKQTGWSGKVNTYSLGANLLVGGSYIHIPIQFVEKGNCLYLHDDYETNKPEYVYNANTSLFEVIRKVVETFDNVEYYESLSNLSTRDTNVFDDKEEKEDFLNNVHMLTSLIKEKGILSNEREEKEIDL